MTNDGLELIRKQVRLRSAVSLDSLYAQRAALVDYIDELRRENEALRAALNGLLSGPSPLYQEARDRLLIVPQHCLDAAERLLAEEGVGP